MVKTTEKPVHISSDESLLAGYREGNEAAAHSLFIRYAPRLRGLAKQYCSPAFAGRFDADDVVQSVFRIFFKGVRREAYTVPPSGEIWALLMVLAVNKIRNLVEFHEADKRTVRQTTPLVESVMNVDDSAAIWLKMVMDEQLEGLPDSNRTIVTLRLDGFEVAEIARQVKRSQRTVERALQSFRVRLAQT